MVSYRETEIGIWVGPKRLEYLKMLPNKKSIKISIKTEAIQEKLQQRKGLRGGHFVL